MSDFVYAQGCDVRPEVALAHRVAWDAIACAGSWWTGEERVAMAGQARAARLQRNEPPWARVLPDADGVLPEAAVLAVRKISADARQIDRAWASSTIAAVGDAPYVELAAVAASVCIIDTFAEALGVELEPLPSPVDGMPDRQRPTTVAEAGAYVPLETPWSGPNVGRALSLVPGQNEMFRGILNSMYAGAPGQGFMNFVWEGPLSRPQTELIAARVSALNECFY
jgi:hypothetical protein